MKRLKLYFSEHHQKIANIVSIFSYIIAIPATILGIWLTYASIKSSGIAVKTQLIEQKKATSVLVVSDFLIELGNRIESKDLSSKRSESIIITRAQLLIDTLTFPDLTNQIVLFLGANGFSHLFDSSRSHKQLKFIDLANSNLKDSKFSHMKFINLNLHCANLENSVLDRIGLMNGNFSFTNLKNATVSGSNFSNASIEWTSFQGVYIGNANFTGANILFSDLRGIYDSQNNLMTKDENLIELAEILIEAKSLYGSILDKNLKNKIISMGKENLLTVFPYEDLKGIEEFDMIKKKYQDSFALAQNNFEKEWKKRYLQYCKK